MPRYAARRWRSTTTHWASPPLTLATRWRRSAVRPVHRTVGGYPAHATAARTSAPAAIALAPLPVLGVIVSPGPEPRGCDCGTERAGQRAPRDREAVDLG